MEGQREVQTFTYPNAIVRVHYPDLSEEENERRMKRIRKAAEELLKDKEVKKREINRNQLL